MPHRKDFQREEDLVVLSELYLKGWSQYKLAEKFKVSQGTISNDLKEIRKRWLDAQINNMDELKQIELQKLDRLEAEFWDAWERSKHDAITTRARKEDGLVTKAVSEIQKVGQVGNPAYLQGALRCIEKRCKILGLNAPDKHEVAGSDGAALQMIFEVVKTPEQAKTDDEQ